MNNFSIFESLQISAKGAWPRVGPSGCDLSAILSASELCGRMTDVRDVNVLLKVSYLRGKGLFVSLGMVLVWHLIQVAINY